MADTVDPGSSVGAVLNQRDSEGASALLLGYTKDIRGFTQDATLENMVANDTLTAINRVMKEMQKTLAEGLDSIAGALSMQLRSRGLMLNAPPPAAGGQSDAIDAQFRDLQESDPRQIESNTGKNDQRSHAENLIAMTQDISDYTGQTAFYMRMLVRDMEEMKKNGDRGGERPAGPPKDKPKGDSGGGEGIFDWLMNTLGISSEIALAAGFFKKFRGRFKNTFTRVGKFFDKTIGFFGKAVSKAATFIEELGGKLLGPIFNVLKGVGEKMAVGITKLGGGKILSAFSYLKNVMLGIGEKFFGPLMKIGGKIFGPLMKLGSSMIGKIGAINFAKAIPIIGEVIMAISAISDAAGALQHSEEITGKAKEFQSLGDKVNVGLSGIISAFTFGLVDPKTIYKWVDYAEGAIGGALKQIFDMFPAPLQKAMSSFYDALFDPKTGIFGSLGIMLEGILDKLGQGDYFGAFMDVVLFVPKAIFNIVQRGFDKLGDIFTGNSDIQKSLWDMIVSMFVAIKDWAVKGITSFASHPMQSLSDIWTKVTDVNSSAREARLNEVQTRTDQINDLLKQGKKKEAANALEKLQSYAENNSLSDDKKFQAGAQANLTLAQQAVASGKPATSVAAQPAQVEDVARTMSDSKKRMDLASQAPMVTVNPIIDMPPSPQPVVPVIRRTEGSLDKALAFSNYTGGG